MLRVRAVLMCVVLAVAMSAAAAASSPQQAPPATPPAPAVPGQKPPAPGQPPGQPTGAQPAGPAPVQSRTFTAPGGLIFTPVRPERIADFEKVMAYFQAALAKSTDPMVREQAAGWRIYKATETAQGGTVLYVYVLDPAVMGSDYGIGKILADAYPTEAAQLWKLYNSAVAGGGTLLNLTPVKPIEPPPLDAPTKSRPAPTVTPGTTPTPNP